MDIQESFNRNLAYFSYSGETLKTEFTYFPFPPVGKPGIINKIKIDSLIDIAVNKFFAIYQKPSARHFIDLFLLIKEKGINWEKLSKLSKIKFDTVIDPLQLGSQLVTVSDMKDMPKMIRRLSPSEWQNYFIGKAKDLAKQIKK